MLLLLKGQSTELYLLAQITAKRRKNVTFHVCHTDSLMTYSPHHHHPHPRPLSTPYTTRAYLRSFIGTLGTIATKHRIGSPASTTTAPDEVSTRSHHVGRHHQTLDGIRLSVIFHPNTLTSFTNEHQILFQNYFEYETSNCHCWSSKRRKIDIV